MTEPLTIRYQCPRCQAQNQATVAQTGDPVGCRSCDWSRHVTDKELNEAGATQCLVCGTEDLWRQKNFPQALGFGFVAIGALGSSIAIYNYRPMLALAVLLAVAAIDFVLFAFMPDVLVCYRCRARHSGGDLSEQPTFDHEKAERYRQEKLRQESS